MNRASEGVPVSGLCDADLSPGCQDNGRAAEKEPGVLYRAQEGSGTAEAEAGVPWEADPVRRGQERARRPASELYDGGTCREEAERG